MSEKDDDERRADRLSQAIARARRGTPGGPRGEGRALRLPPPPPFDPADLRALGLPVPAKGTSPDAGQGQAPERGPLVLGTPLPPDTSETALPDQAAEAVPPPLWPEPPAEADQPSYEPPLPPETGPLVLGEAIPPAAPWEEPRQEETPPEPARHWLPEAPPFADSTPLLLGGDAGAPVPWPVPQADPVLPADEETGPEPAAWEPGAAPEPAGPGDEIGTSASASADAEMRDIGQVPPVLPPRAGSWAEADPAPLPNWEPPSVPPAGPYLADASELRGKPPLSFEMEADAAPLPEREPPSEAPDALAPLAATGLPGEHEDALVPEEDPAPLPGWQPPPAPPADLAPPAGSGMAAAVPEAAEPEAVPETTGPEAVPAAAPATRPLFRPGAPAALLPAATAAAPLLRLRDLHTDIGRYHILRGVSFDVPKGGVTMLLGRNGAGKTTTLRSIMGLWRPRLGSAVFDGSELAGLAPTAIARRGVGYVPEDMGIFGSLTVEENMRLGALSGRFDRDRLDRLLAAFPSLRSFWHKQAGTLSGGQKQMLSLARAMIEPRALYLIDEPTKGLAPAIVATLAGALRALKAEGATILMVEQNFAMARALGDTCVVMEDGRVVWQGEMAALAADAGLQERLMGLSLEVGR